MMLFIDWFTNSIKTHFSNNRLQNFFANTSCFTVLGLRGKILVGCASMDSMEAVKDPKRRSRKTKGKRGKGV